MNKTHLRTITFLLCWLFLLPACTSPLNQITTTPDGVPVPTPPGINTNDPGSTTSTISIGNPKMRVTLDSTVYLSLQASSNNLKQIQDTTLASVLSFTDPSIATLPSAKQFVLGPNGEMVIEFQTATLWDSQNCILLYATTETTTCVQDYSMNIEGAVQFDAAGNVFYAGKTTGQDFVSLTKWNPSTAEKTSLINQNITLGQWRVHANGLVYLTGSAETTPFFRTIDPTNNVVTNLVADASDVTSFNFIDAEHLILQGQNIYYNNAYQAGNFVFDATTGTITERLDSTGGDLDHLQIDSTNRVYVIADNTIRMIYPGVSTEVVTGLGQVSLFKIYNDILYTAGQTGLTQQLVAIDLNDSTATARVLLANSEVYHLEYDNDALYFDALDFSNNTLAIQKYDLTSASISTIQTVGDELVQLKSVATLQNYSFETRDFDETLPYRVQISYTNTDIKLLPMDLNLKTGNCYQDDALAGFNNVDFLVSCLGHLVARFGQGSNAEYLDVTPNTGTEIKDVFVISKSDHLIGVVQEQNLDDSTSQKMVIYSFSVIEDPLSVTLKPIDTYNQEQGHTSTFESGTNEDSFLVLDQTTKVLSLFGSVRMKELLQLDLSRYEGDISIIGVKDSSIFLGVTHQIGEESFEAKVLMVHDNANSLDLSQTATINSAVQGFELVSSSSVSVFSSFSVKVAIGPGQYYIVRFFQQSPTLPQILKIED